MEQQNKEKVTINDKAFTRLMITSLIGFLVCVACLCSTTWAWFSDNAPSHGNEIKMADTFSLTVAVEGGGEAIPDASGNIALTAGVDYTVTMTLPAESASGYCILTAGDVEYYTDYLTAHTEATPRVTSFTLTVKRFPRELLCSAERAEMTSKTRGRRGLIPISAAGLVTIP